MTRKTLKVSGLVLAGKVQPVANSKETNSFDTQDTPRQETKNAEGEIREINLALIDDSPFQPRKFYDTSALDELAQSLAAGKLREPISVRAVGNRYELISGHRRVRAARSIGWATIRALVLARTDREAELDAILQNESRVDLTDYERAKVYRYAAEAGYVKGQVETAQLFGCSQTKVSNCLTMLTLPAPFIALLEEHPALFSSKTALVIKTLLKDHPAHHDVIIKGVERLLEGAEQSTTKAWVEQMIKQKTRTIKHVPKNVITNQAGQPVFTAQVKDRDIVIRVTDPALDAETVQKWVMAALRERADKPN